MLNKFEGEDFAVLRGLFESGRQNPGALGAMLLISTLLQGLMYAVTRGTLNVRTGKNWPMN